MANPYEQDLDKNPANFQPLTPLTFLERAAGADLPDVRRRTTSNSVTAEAADAFSDAIRPAIGMPTSKSTRSLTNRDKPAPSPPIATACRPSSPRPP